MKASSDYQDYYWNDQHEDSEESGKSIGTYLKSLFIIIRDSLNLVRKNLKGIIGFELLYRILVYLVVFPLLSWLQRLLTVVNRTSVIAAFNIRRVMMNPLSWIIFALVILVMTGFASFERFAMVDALHASRCGIKRTTGQIFSTGFDLTLSRFRPQNWMLIVYVLVILHLGSLEDVSGVTSFLHLPGYILEYFEQHQRVQLLFQLCVVAGVYFNIRWIYAVPVMMEEDDVSFSDGVAKSVKMTKGKHFFSLLILVGMWNLLILLLSALLTFCVVLTWYILSVWLMPGQTPVFTTFIAERFTGTGLVCGLVSIWLVFPLTLCSVQAAYYRRKEAMGESILPYTEECGYFRKYPAIRAAVVVTFGLCIFFSGPRRFSQIRWMMNTEMGMPLIMAHRGYSGAAPENTIPAFEKAIEAGFTAAVLDVQMLGDGTIVVMHDSSFARTTGYRKRVWETTYDEIKDLDAGKYFSSEYEGTRIPTLDEVLKLCSGKLFLNIEIKRTGHDEGIVERVVRIIEENDYFDNCDITSQDYRTLEEVRAINPSVITAYTSVAGIGNLQSLEAADIFSIMEYFATYENVTAIRDAGKRIFVWTVNDADTMESLINLNVDAILTNEPELCRRVMDGYSSQVMNVVKRLVNALSFL